MKRAIILVTVFSCSFLSIVAQIKNQQYLAYISLYSEVAMSHQREYKIPSSITLAQGLLESGAGNSMLTRESNNHFGIKCHNGWTGPKVYHDDDKKDDCFRKYDRAQDSYQDHSMFLSRNPRYAFLFELDIRDYRGWATGLQRAGYATDKSYANKLINVIELYELYQYDVLAMGKVKAAKSNEKMRQKEPEHEVYMSQKLIYVIAKRGDTYESLSAELGFKVKTLTSYNEVPEDFPLSEGDIVYLQKKNRKVKDFSFHVIKPGESIHSISQMYGVRMNRIYKLNKLNDEYIPNDGDTLKLK